MLGINVFFLVLRPTDAPANAHYCGLGMDALANGVLAWMLWQRDLSSSREEEEEEQE